MNRSRIESEESLVTCNAVCSTTYSQRQDHPILATIPETQYLTGFAYEVIASW